MNLTKENSTATSGNNQHNYMAAGGYLFLKHTKTCSESGILSTQRAVHTGFYWAFWYDISHPLGEGRSALSPPPEAVQQTMISALETHFVPFEVAEKSGCPIWEQIPPNPRLANDLKASE